MACVFKLSRTAEHVKESPTAPLPSFLSFPPSFLCAHIHTLLSSPVAARLKCDLDLIAEGLFKSLSRRRSNHVTPFTHSLTPHPLPWPCMSMRMRGRRHSPQACVQLQGLSFSWVISPRWSGVKVVSERMFGPNCPSPSLNVVSISSDCGDERSRFSHPHNS